MNKLNIKDLLGFDNAIKYERIRMKSFLTKLAADELLKKINKNRVVTLLKSYESDDDKFYRMQKAKDIYLGRSLRLGNNEKALNDFLNTVSIIDIYDSIEGLK